MNRITHLIPVGNCIVDLPVLMFNIHLSLTLEFGFLGFDEIVKWDFSLRVHCVSLKQ